MRSILIALFFTGTSIFVGVHLFNLIDTLPKIMFLVSYLSIGYGLHVWYTRKSIEKNNKDDDITIESD